MSQWAHFDTDNSGRGELKVPGFSKIPLDWERHPWSRFEYAPMGGVCSHRLTAREVAMLQLMDALTDEVGWHLKIFDEKTVADWRSAALARTLISPAAWDWCLAELRDKVSVFEETQRILVYNTCSGICKSDTVVPETLRNALRHGAMLLLLQSEPTKDWHPYSNQQLINLVDPSLYPLIYGRTLVLADGGQVGLESFAASYGYGTKAPSCPGDEPGRANASSYQQNYYRTLKGGCQRRLFSSRFQWLPCEVEFTERSGTDVRITSYINNLHPIYHKWLYQTIERLISLIIPAWNDVLVKGSGGRTPMRIKTDTVEWKLPLPAWEGDVGPELIEKMSDGEYDEFCRKASEFLSLPEPEDFVRSRHFFNDLTDRRHRNKEGRMHVWDAIKTKSVRLAQVQHPEPGVSFTYADWKAGDTKGPGMKKTPDSRRRVIQPDSVPKPGPDHQYYSIALQDTFREQGLQTIIKLSSVELTPDKPVYEGGWWHDDSGLLNEKIVATAVYYYDVDNITDIRLSFCHDAAFNDMYFNNSSSDSEGFAETFGIDGRQIVGTDRTQQLGSISMLQGRLVVFPKTIYCSTEPFALVDQNRPGHCRFIVVSLVDPHYRICSTRNVPPQQHTWWKDALYRNGAFPPLPIPLEVEAMIMKETGEWPMGFDEAADTRMALLDDHLESREQIRSMTSRYYIGWEVAQGMIPWEAERSRRIVVRNTESTNRRTKRRNARLLSDITPWRLTR